jgi:hypothetical protein
MRFSHVLQITELAEWNTNIKRLTIIDIHTHIAQHATTLYSVLYVYGETEKAGAENINIPTTRGKNKIQRKIQQTSDSHYSQSK